MPRTEPVTRLMAFIDGENLLARFQAMLPSRVVQPAVVHRTNEFVWQPNLHLPGRFEVARASYFTSVVGDDPKVAEVVDAIRKVPFCSNEITAHQTFLFARIHKKPSKSQKDSTIDIQLTTDLLSQVYQGTTDAVFLITGDGDFVPVAEAVVTRGVRLFIGALSEGLNAELPRLCDQFINLDPLFFMPPKAAA